MSVRWSPIVQQNLRAADGEPGAVAFTGPGESTGAKVGRPRARKVAAAKKKKKRAR